MASRENDSFYRYGPPGWSFSRHSFLLKLRFKKDCDLAKITQVGLKSRSSVIPWCSLCRYQVPGTPNILPTTLQLGHGEGSRMPILGDHLTNPPPLTG